MIVVEGVADQNIIKKAKMIGVHLVPDVFVGEPLFEDFQNLFKNTQVAGLTGSGIKFLLVFRPELPWLFFNERKNFIFFG